MATIVNRIRALEERNGGNGMPRRVYGVIGGPEGADPADFIRAQGYDFDDNADMVIHIQPFAASANGPRRMDEHPFGWCGKRPPDAWRAAA